MIADDYCPTSATVNRSTEIGTTAIVIWYSSADIADCQDAEPASDDYQPEYPEPMTIARSPPDTRVCIYRHRIVSGDVWAFEPFEYAAQLLQGGF